MTVLITMSCGQQFRTTIPPSTPISTLDELVNDRRNAIVSVEIEDSACEHILNESVS